MQAECNICGVKYDPEIQQHQSPAACVVTLSCSVKTLVAAINRLNEEVEKCHEANKAAEERLFGTIKHLEERHVRLAERVVKIEFPPKPKKQS